MKKKMRMRENVWEKLNQHIKMEIFINFLSAFVLKGDTVLEGLMEDILEEYNDIIEELKYKYPYIEGKINVRDMIDNILSEVPTPKEDIENLKYYVEEVTDIIVGTVRYYVERYNSCLERYAEACC